MMQNHNALLNKYIGNKNLRGVVLNITNRCNLKCLHCFNGSSLNNDHEGELKDEEIIDIIDQCVEMKVSNVCFSGGEPLVRKSLLFRCLKTLNNSKIRTSIVSNGTLIDNDTAYILKTLGVSEIEISLDGIKPETHERLRCIRGSWHAAMESIKYLVNVGLTTSISFTLTSWNGDEFIEMVEELSRIGVYGVYIRPLIVMGTAFKNESSLVANSTQFRKIVRDVCTLKMKHTNIEISMSDPLNHVIYYSRYNSFNPHVEIQADGRLQCSYCITYSYGNLKRHTLREYCKAGLARAWEIPEIARVTSGIYCYDDLSEAIKEIPDLMEGQLSHCDIVDDGKRIWERGIV